MSQRSNDCVRGEPGDEANNLYKHTYMGLWLVLMQMAPILIYYNSACTVALHTLQQKSLLL